MIVIEFIRELDGIVGVVGGRDVLGDLLFWNWV